MTTCSIHRHGKDPKDLILADPSFNIEITLLSVNVTIFWQLFGWHYQSPSCLCLHCQMFRRCSSWHNQHQTCQKFKWSDIWILPKLSVLVNVMWFLNPHNFLFALPWKNFPDNGQGLFLGDFASGEVHFELLDQNLDILLSELVALWSFVQANCRRMKMDVNMKRVKNCQKKIARNKLIMEEEIEATKLRRIK